MMNRVQAASLVAIFGLVFGPQRPASATIIHALGDASTVGFGQGASTGSVSRGWDFLVNAPNVEVVQLGVNAATSGTLIRLSLWNDHTETLLVQTTATSTANGWVFVNLGTPIDLTAGVEYSVIGWANVSTPWYLFNNTPPVAFNPTGTIEYIDTRFANGEPANSFPTGTIPTPAQYGVTDIGYQVPEPSSVALAGIATLAGLWVWTRRRRRI